jgi:ABC-2 type transport system ATP-binding protein
MNNIIETNHLSRHFRKLDAVKDLNLQVPQGSVYAFLGRNGAGKTTTIKMIAGLIEPHSGKSLVLGQPSRNLKPEHWQQIGYVSENQKLYEWMKGDELINFTSKLYPNWDINFCNDLIKKLSLSPILNRKIKNYSRGEKVKLALLLSLAYRPKLLILDEPFSGLDSLVRDEFLSSLLEMTSQNEWSIFFSTHEIDEVEKLADHVGIIERGTLKLSEKVEELQSRFRQLEILGSNLSSHALLKDGLLGIEHSENRIKFVHPHFRSDVETQLHTKFPESQIRVNTLTLREIFIALARRFQEEGAQ